MSAPSLTAKQKIFTELFVGTLIYVVVLGFFRDYTNIVTAKSFSSVFLAAIVLEILTFFTLKLKTRIVSWLKDKSGILYRILLFFSVWFVMFISKFVFIAALDLIFRRHVYIHGFFGILFVVISVTVLHKIATIVFQKLAE